MFQQTFHQRARRLGSSEILCDDDFSKMLQLILGAQGSTRPELMAELRARAGGVTAANAPALQPSTMFFKGQRMTTANLPPALRNQPDSPARVVAWNDIVSRRAGVPIQPYSAPFNRQDLQHRTSEKDRTLITDQQSMLLQSMLRDWSALGADIVSCASEAHKELASMVDAMSKQRQNIIALSARATWLLLTIAAPAPWGPLVGTLCRCIASNDTWTTSIKTAVEWGLQTPFPHNRNTNRIDVTLPFGSPERITQYARANHPGGHPQVNNVKDAHQVLKGGLENCFIGGPRETFDRWNQATLQGWLKMAQPRPVNGDHLLPAIQSECQQRIGAIWQAIINDIHLYTNDRASADKLITASWYGQKAAIEANLQGGLYDNDRARYTEQTIQQGVDLFLNTVVHRTIDSLLANTRNRAVPKLDKKTAKEQFQRLILAEFFQATMVPATEARDPATLTFAERARGAVSSWSGPNPFGFTSFGGDQWATGIGTVRSALWSTLLETKLLELGITRRTTNVADVENWTPPAGRDDTFQPVPYQNKDHGACGRLAAWAVGYARIAPEIQLTALMDLVP